MLPAVPEPTSPRDARRDLGARGSASCASREAMVRRMGGDDKIERQHAGGKLTVRERIDALLDAGSFHEIGALAGRAAYGEDGGARRRSCRPTS